METFDNNLLSLLPQELQEEFKDQLLALHGFHIVTCTTDRAFSFHVEKSHEIEDKILCCLQFGESFFDFIVNKFKTLALENLLQRRMIINFVNGYNSRLYTSTRKYSVNETVEVDISEFLSKSGKTYDNLRHTLFRVVLKQYHSFFMDCYHTYRITHNKDKANESYDRLQVQLKEWVNIFSSMSSNNLGLKHYNNFKMRIYTTHGLDTQSQVSTKRIIETKSFDIEFDIQCFKFRIHKKQCDHNFITSSISRDMSHVTTTTNNIPSLQLLTLFWVIGTYFKYIDSIRRDVLSVTYDPNNNIKDTTAAAFTMFDDPIFPTFRNINEDNKFLLVYKNSLFWECYKNDCLYRESILQDLKRLKDHITDATTIRRLWLQDNNKKTFIFIYTGTFDEIVQEFEAFIFTCEFDMLKDITVVLKIIPPGIDGDNVSTYYEIHLFNSHNALLHVHLQCVEKNILCV